MAQFDPIGKVYFKLPIKSPAVALLFCVFLGPIGLLYSTVMGGIVMIILGLAMFRLKMIGILILVWLISCAWSVAAVNLYNKKMLMMKNL